MCIRDREVDLPPDRSPRPATARSRGPCAHPPAGPGEPPLGLCPDRGRAPQARHPGGCDDDPDPAPDGSPRSCPAADGPDLDRVPPGSSARDHRLRLLYRRDGLAAHPLRPRVHRARQPADLSQPVNGSPGLGGGPPEQARNLALDLDARASPVRFLIRDRDTKFCRGFDEVVRSEGARVIRTPIRAPNANAHAERVIETMRAECLDWTLIQRSAPSQSNPPDLRRALQPVSYTHLTLPTILRV